MKRGPLPGFRLDPDTTAVPLHDLLGHGQADTGAGALRSGVETLKEQEDPVAVLRIEAHPVVADRELPLAFPFLGPDVHGGRAEGAECEGVGDQIVKQLADLGGIRQDLRQPVVSDDGGGLVDALLQAGKGRGQLLLTGSGLEPGAAGGHAGVLDQAIDALLDLCHAFQCRCDQVVALGTELAVGVLGQ